MTDYGPLLARIATRAAEDEPMLPLADRPAPSGAEEIDRAERALGFTLHPLLAAVYRNFANGGFGPDYQLLSLVDGPTGEQAVDVYLASRSEGAGTEWAWPEVDAPSLEAWFEAYISRTGWWDMLENGDEPDIQPWPGFKARASG